MPNEPQLLAAEITWHLVMYKKNRKLDSISTPSTPWAWHVVEIKNTCAVCLEYILEPHHTTLSRVSVLGLGLDKHKCVSCINHDTPTSSSKSNWNIYIYITRSWYLTYIKCTIIYFWILSFNKFDKLFHLFQVWSGNVNQFMLTRFVEKSIYIDSNL